MHEQDYGICQCGCGQKTKLCPYSAPSIGWVKGEPKRFIHGHQSRKPGPKHEERDLGYKTPCWIFLGYISKKGYGQMRPHGAKRMYPAHCAYYMEHVGPIPEGMTLDHICHNAVLDCPGGPTCPHRACVNPEHLVPRPAVENTKLGRKPGSKPGKARPQLHKTHCKRGHEFTLENTNIGSDGQRRCRTCQNAAMLRHYYRTRGAKP